MRTYFEGTIKLHERKDFIGQDGQPVIFFTYFIQSFDPNGGETLKINSAVDFTEYADQLCKITLEARQIFGRDKDYTLKLIHFEPVENSPSVFDDEEPTQLDIKHKK